MLFSLPRSLVLGPLFLGAALLGGACMESSYDVFIEGMTIEGAAERRHCQLGYDASTQTNAISSNRIAECLYQLRKAHKLYQKAKTLGHTGRDFENKLTDVEMKIKRVEGMLRMVGSMERDSLEFTPP